MLKDFRIFESESMAIAFEASRYSNRETGGDLFGLWTAGGNPVVFLATGPGPSARGQSVEYEMDIAHMEKCEDMLLSMFGIHYLGDWHSHHGLGLCRPSGGDQERIRNLSRKNSRTHMCEIIVNHVSEGGYREQISMFVYTHGSINDSNACVLETSVSPVRKTLLGQRLQRGINLIDGQVPINSILLSSRPNISQTSSFKNPAVKSDYQISTKTIKIILER